MIKNILKNIKIKNKKIALIFFIITFFILIIPNPSYAMNPILVATLIAPVVGLIGGAISIAVAVALIVAIFFSVGYYGDFIMRIAVVFLEYAANPVFASSYTTFENPLIAIGWPIVRDLANIGLVVGLIFIGLATALRIQGYQAQKTLPILLVVAILINFSPVLCGLVIDASNIIMNYFLDTVVGENSALPAFIWKISEFGKGFFQLQKFLDNIGVPNYLFLAISYVFYILLFGFGLFVLGAILMIRHLAIWFLVILSPIAFVCYIFPATRKLVWGEWLKNFLGWCFIGVIFSFFLFISVHLMGLVIGNPDFELPELWTSEWQITKRSVLQRVLMGPMAGAWGIFTLRKVEILTGSQEAIALLYGVYFLVIISLYTGIYVGFKSNAMGVSAIFSIADKHLSPGAIKNWAYRTSRKTGSAVGGAAAAAAKVGLQKRLTVGGQEMKDQEDLATAEKRVALLDDNKLEGVIKRKAGFRDDSIERAAAISRAIQEGKDELYDDSDIKRAIQGGFLKKEKVIPYRPDLSPHFKNDEGQELTIEKTLGKMSSKERFEVHEKSFDNAEVLASLYLESEETINKEAGKWSPSKRMAFRVKSMQNSEEIALKIREKLIEERGNQNTPVIGEIIEDNTNFLSQNPLFGGRAPEDTQQQGQRQTPHRTTPRTRSTRYM